MISGTCKYICTQNKHSCSILVRVNCTGFIGVQRESGAPGEHGSRGASIGVVRDTVGSCDAGLQSGDVAALGAQGREGVQGVVVPDGSSRLQALEKEVRELRRANEILRTASAFFAQAELDCKLK